MPAIVDGFYLGEETGTAVAAVLLGDVSPAGRLPVTVPRTVGSVPAFYNHKPSARRLYLFEEPGPLWAFGHGLSYTTFAYGKPVVTPARIPPTGRATVAVTVRNTGKRASDEVVQLYLRDVVSTVTRPVQELKGFRRIFLKPGEAKKVEFVLTADELSLVDEHMKRVVEPGRFEIMVGAADRRAARSRWTSAPRAWTSAPRARAVGTSGRLFRRSLEACGRRRTHCAVATTQCTQPQVPMFIW